MFWTPKLLLEIQVWSVRKYVITAFKQKTTQMKWYWWQCQIFPNPDTRMTYHMKINLEQTWIKTLIDILPKMVRKNITWSDLFEVLSHELVFSSSILRKILPGGPSITWVNLFQRHIPFFSPLVWFCFLIFQAAYVGLAASWISSFPASLFETIGTLPGSLWVSRGTLFWSMLIAVIYHISALQWVTICLYVGYGVDRWTRVSYRHNILVHIPLLWN